MHLYFKNRHKILAHSVKDIKQNGIKRGLNTTAYRIKSIEKTMLFTRIYVKYANKN